MSVTINTCKDCAHLGVTRYYTADSWEHVMTWYCRKVKRPKPETTDRQKKVQNSSKIKLVEYPREEPKEIPDWCPLRG